MSEDTPSINISSHAEQRLKQRLGLPIRAARRAALNAYIRGARHGDFKGPLRKYIERRRKTGYDENSADDIAVYAGNLYCFAGTTLITVWPVPEKLKSMMK